MNDIQIIYTFIFAMLSLIAVNYYIDCRMWNSEMYHFWMGSAATAGLFFAIDTLTDALDITYYIGFNYFFFFLLVLIYACYKLATLKREDLRITQENQNKNKLSQEDNTYGD